MVNRKKRLGNTGEDIAINFFKKRGYKILERNFRTKKGEIDLIVEGEGQLVFVEVKTRSSKNFGDPLEFVNISKQKRILAAALFYLTKNKLWQKNIRFDIIGITKRGEKIEIKHEKEAFTLEHPLDSGNSYWQPW
ncbi:YraN family protein [Desulfothermus naphthae]